MSEYRIENNGSYRRRERSDQRALRQGSYDRQSQLSAEAQARANAAGTYDGPARSSDGRPRSSDASGQRRQEQRNRNRDAQREQNQDTRRNRGERESADRRRAQRASSEDQRPNRTAQRTSARRSAAPNRDADRARAARNDADRNARTSRNDDQRFRQTPDSRQRTRRIDQGRPDGRPVNRQSRPSASDDAVRRHRLADDQNAPRRDGQTSRWETEGRTHTPKEATSAPSTMKRPAGPSDGTLEESMEPAKRSYLANKREFAIIAFNGILTFGLVLGLCFFLRPSVSQAENRQLTEFPQLTWQALIDGDFTEGVSTWYADTYPFRDKLMAVNQRFKSLYGYESDTQMYGAAATADEIPTETVEEAPKKDPVAPETYDSWNLEEDIQGQIMQGLYVKDGSVYATYGFTQEAANDYVNAVNNVADKLDGTTKVYSILIPNNSGVLLGEDELAALGGSNQGQAIQYYYDSYNDKVTSIETMDTLVKHKDEYLFFRTDHHWTALAAYYIYQNFCSAKEIEPHQLDQFEEQDFSPFLGSYYQQLQLESLAANPDTVQAWIPMGTNDMVYTDVDGSTVDWKVIQDVSEWDDGTKYNCFVGGDEPWAEIHNPAITDGSSCVVVKESYGNAFIPWLVDHYETVYIADFRYTNVNVADFCQENEVDDLILCNNISIIGSVEVAGKIASIL